MRGVDLSELKMLGSQYVESARSQLTARGEVTPLVALLNPIEGTSQILLIDPQLLLSEQGKDSMFQGIKSRLDSGGFSAIMTMFDSHQLRAKDAAEFDQIMRLRHRGIPSKEINEKFRLGTYTEAVVLSVETIDGGGFKMTLEYARDPLRFRPVREADGLPWDSSRMRFFGKELKRGSS